ncbi:MAG: flagellar basal-body rod protein FlgG [Solimonas sp.]
MLDAIYTSLSALHSQQVRLDITSNNLANVNTTGFKKQRAVFSDLVYPAGQNRDGADPAEVAQGPAFDGFGTRISRIRPEFSVGDLRQTGRTLDLAIQGQGFFEVERADGSLAYTRLGSLSLNDAGELTTADGLKLTHGVQIPSDAITVIVDKNGVVSAKVPDQAQAIELGQLELANFTNPEGLAQVGDGLYKSTDDSGEVFMSNPDENGVGVLRQGFLEASNVDFVEELVELSMAQRAYQMNARVLQAADEMLAEVNGLRR